MAWSAIGPPCASVYVPVFLCGDLPAAFHAEDPMNLGRRFQNVQSAMSRDGELWNQFRHSLALLQSRLDLQTEEFCAEAAALKSKGESGALGRQASLFMESQLEQLQAELQRFQLVRSPESEKVVVLESDAYAF
jgi:hypothetical protein